MRKLPVVLLICLSSVAVAGTINAYRGYSIVDCLESKNKPSDFEARKELAEAKGIADYRGTGSQNQRLLALICGGPSKVPPVAPRHPRISAQMDSSIEAYVRQVARKHRIDENKFVNTARCESQFYATARGDGGGSRGMWQFNRQSHPEVTDELAYNWKTATEIAANIFQKRPTEWTCYRLYYGNSRSTAE